MSVAWMLVAIAGAQEAGDFSLYPSRLIEEVPETYLANGAGAPSVTYDPVAARWMMVFETRLDVVDPACPVGVWALGLATSADGLSWDTLPTVLLEPAVDTYYSCVAAHPTTVYDPVRQKLYVFFKAEQGTGACDEGVPPWGCDRYTGVGRVTVDFDAEGVSGAPAVLGVPALGVSGNMGFPKFVSRGGLNYLFYSQAGEVLRASSDRMRSFVVDDAPPLGPSFALWAEDEVFNPAAACSDADGFLLWPGGRTYDELGVLTTAGWGRSASADGDAWTHGPAAIFLWADDLSWRHWEVLPLDSGPDDYLVYFSAKDATTLKPYIGVAGSAAPGWTGADLHTRMCD